MCGRYALTLPPDAVRAYFGYREQPNFPPRTNIAPTQPVAFVRAGRQAEGLARHFALARWGFLPGFVKDPKSFPLLINARAEGLAGKPSFRAAARRRRCLAPADGWYEWLRQPGLGGKIVRRPHLFRRPDRGPLALAALYETWSDPQGGEIDTLCLSTVEANATAAAVHNRMPALIAPENFDLWLDCEDDRAAGDALALLKPAPEGSIEGIEVGALVNRAANEGPELQKPVGAP